MKRKNSVLVYRWYSPKNSGAKKRRKAVSSEHQAPDWLWKPWLVELPRIQDRAHWVAAGCSCPTWHALWLGLSGQTLLTHHKQQRAPAAGSGGPSAPGAPACTPGWSCCPGTRTGTARWAAQPPSGLGNSHSPPVGTNSSEIPQNRRASSGRGTWCASARDRLDPTDPTQPTQMVPTAKAIPQLKC